MKNNVSRILVRLLALVLIAALCPVTALGDGTYSPQALTNAVVQVLYATPEGNLRAELVNVNPVNNVVYPNASYVPAGYEPVNASPVKLIFNAMGQPIPAVIYFTYQRSTGQTQPQQQAYTITVKYATVEGVFATGTVYVTANANVISADPAKVPAGYIPFGNNQAVIPFGQDGKPTITEVLFYYYKQVDVQPVVTTTPQPTPAVPNMTADQVVANWTLPGQIVTYGSYEQDNNTENGKEPVEWIVLRTQAGRALLLSRYALHTRPYHSEWAEVSWADCRMRSWLNNTFYNECFSSFEKPAVIQASLKTNYAGTSVSTKDYVFLLDAVEAKNISQDILYCRPTASVKVSTEKGYCYWWLRDTTNRKSDANRVHPNGLVYEYGANTNATGVGVRPAIWVDIRLAFGYK